MVRICIQIFRIPLEWFEFTFFCFESLWNGSNLDWNTSNPFQIVRICIQMLWILFEWLEFVLEWFEFAFECFKSLSNGWNLQLKMWLEWLEFAFERFESFSNLHSNASNHFRMVRICIWMLWMPFERLEFVCECFELAFKCFERLSSG